MNIKPLCFALCLFVPATAPAQIISQTPRPEIVIDDTESIATIETKNRGTRSGQTILTPKAGALLFAGFDRNSDYKIDKTEVKSGIKAAYRFADKDNDGLVTLVELEAWRAAALGSADAAPTNFLFAPNFARTVSLEKFSEVLEKLAAQLDRDAQGEQDGIIEVSSLLRSYSPPRPSGDENCAVRVREERRRVEQLCRQQQRR